MTNFLKKVFIFFALIVVIDIACGFTFEFLKSHAKGGDTQKNYYISEKCKDDILILGSSRAVRHYDPNIFEDTMNMACYNCGEPGCGIITAYARYCMVEGRHKPKMVIYEVTPEYDFFKTDDYSKYLGRVRQYANKAEVRNLFIEFGDQLEGFRLLSNMYKNNSFIVHNIMDNMIKSENNNGYNPLNGVLNPNLQERPLTPQYAMDSTKLDYIEKLIKKLKKDGIPIYFIVSPKYISQNEAKAQESDYKPIVELCGHYDIPFINHTYMNNISTDPTLFNDYNHLNRDGAKMFSLAICKEIKDTFRNIPE